MGIQLITACMSFRSIYLDYDSNNPLLPSEVLVIAMKLNGSSLTPVTPLVALARTTHGMIGSALLCASRLANLIVMQAGYLHKYLGNVHSIQRGYSASTICRNGCNKLITFCSAGLNE